MMLSFCIPTYNREVHLRENIIAIIQQLNDSIINEVEICVSDNCSTDGTIGMLEVLKNEFKDVNLVYKSNIKNIGPDLNYLESVKIASGKYCWFVGSDDVIKVGAVEEIINVLKRKHFDIVICNRLECDENLKPIYYKSWYNNKDGETSFELTDKSQLNRYLKISKDTACVFSYLSSIIFYREKWDNIEYDNSFTGTAYSHVFMLFSFLKFDSCILGIVDKDMIICRITNETVFMDNGLANRIFIDFDGYYKISQLPYFDIDSKKLLLKLIAKAHPLYRLLRIKSYSNLKEWNKLYTALLLAKYPKSKLFVLKTVPLSFINIFWRMMPLFTWLKKTTKYTKYKLGIK